MNCFTSHGSHNFNACCLKDEKFTKKCCRMFQFPIKQLLQKYERSAYFDYLFTFTELTYKSNVYIYKLYVYKYISHKI